jgi:hypothetical protein
MIFSSSFTTTSFLREDYGLRFHNIIGFFYDATSENIRNSMILKMDSRYFWILLLFFMDEMLRLVTILSLKELAWSLECGTIRKNQQVDKTSRRELHKRHR